MRLLSRLISILIASECSAGMVHEPNTLSAIIIIHIVCNISIWNLLRPDGKDSRERFYLQANNIVTNARRILLYPSFGNNVDMNSSMSFGKVGRSIL